MKRAETAFKEWLKKKGSGEGTTQKSPVEMAFINGYIIGGLEVSQQAVDAVRDTINELQIEIDNERLNVT